MSEFLTKFGNKIKNYRKIACLSQEKLAELVNVSTNTISSLERGLTFIKYDTLKKICRVLNINEVDLFDFPMSNKRYSSIIDEINNEIKLLSPKQQKQILEILKTFK